MKTFNNLIKLVLAAGLLLVSAAPMNAAEATVNLSAKVSGLVDGTFNLSAPAFTSTSAALGQRSILAVGGTGSWVSLAIPTTSVGMLVVMPAGNTATVQLSSSSAGTNPISLGANSYFAFLPLAAGQTLYASGSAAVSLAVTYF